MFNSVINEVRTCVLMKISTFPSALKKISQVQCPNLVTQWPILQTPLIRDRDFYANWYRDLPITRDLRRIAKRCETFEVTRDEKWEALDIQNSLRKYKAITFGREKSRTSFNPKFGVGQEAHHCRLYFDFVFQLDCLIGLIRVGLKISLTDRQFWTKTCWEICPDGIQHLNWID